MTPNRTDRHAREPETPNDTPKARHVRIIYVPLARVLADMQTDTLGSGPVGIATLAHVEKHIGVAAPTDVVVFNKQPWNFAGHGNDKSLRAHPQVHIDFPETILVLKPGEEAVWTSDKEFEITRIQPSGGTAHSHPGFEEAPGPFPDYPFASHPILTREETPGRWVAHSGVPKTAAQKHMYKISFSIETDDIDPDVYCGGSN
jgi:hypothetical protein